MTAPATMERADDERRFLGIGNRCEPDANGWTLFLVWRDITGKSWWQALDDDEEGVGFRHGPFDGPRRAYLAALDGDDALADVVERRYPRRAGRA